MPTQSQHTLTYDTSVTVTAGRPEFYGRAAALHELHTHTSAIRGSGTGVLVTLTGRRQVGKSRLITEFALRSRLPCLYYTARADSAPSRHFQDWARAFGSLSGALPDAETRSRLDGEPQRGDLAEPLPRDWSDAFAALARACSSTPCIVVLDDFEQAVRVEPTLPAIVARSWQRQLRQCPVLFVVVGSAGELTPHATPMTLLPLNPAECAHALGRRPAVAAFDTHLITGGTPRLVAGCAQAGDPYEFVRAQLHDENSDLVVMGERLVATEVAESASARTVLAAIGAEPQPLTSFTRIVAQLPSTGVTAQTAATRALKLLTQRQVVAAHTPVGAPANTKLRRYRIDDSSLRFWHFFVRPHLGDIARGRVDLAVAAFDASWTSWRAAAMHPVVHAALRRLTLTMPEFTRAADVGAWWNREGRELDIVLSARRNQPMVAVGAIKWDDGEPFTADDQRAVDEARSMLPNAERATSLAICPAGARPGAGVDVVLDADALLAAW